MPDSKISNILNNESNKEELQGLQLRREHELNDGKEESKRIQVVKFLIGPVFRDYVQIMIKSGNLSPQDKQNLINAMKNIG